MSTESALLDVRRLSVHFPVRKRAILGRAVGYVRAVDDVSFTINAGETLGLVGESGSGKSTTGRAILQLKRPTAGQVLFKGMDLCALDGDRLRLKRREMQMIFQDPFASLNPRMTVGELVGEPLIVHGLASGTALRERTSEMLGMVGLDPSVGDHYPHEFSGGQRQRIGIARALMIHPDFVVCDEPVSALDVSIQAQIINLLVDLQEQLRLTYLFISHDLSIVRHVSDTVAVMYLGKIVETTTRERLYADPLHPYTQALLGSVLEADPKRARGRQRKRLVGEIPSPLNPPSGCHFRTRCPLADAECAELEPAFEEKAPGHWVACHKVRSLDPPDC